MKKLLLLVLSITTFTTYSQVVNGSFENGSGADLSSWEWTCAAQPFNSAPSGGGNWSIQVFGGNLQGCFPGYAYQKIPSITNGQSFILSGVGYGDSAPVGIFFGSINNGVFDLQAGATTSSNSWDPLSVQSSFNLLTGDTAVVVLFAGVSTGPIQTLGFFDLINLQQVTGISDLEQKHFKKIFPMPFSTQTILQTNSFFKNATLTIYNSVGQPVKEMINLSGNKITLQRENLSSGLYFVRLTQENKILATDNLIITEN